jgi:hypothetical protein
MSGYTHGRRDIANEMPYYLSFFEQLSKKERHAHIMLFLSLARVWVMQKSGMETTRNGEIHSSIYAGIILHHDSPSYTTRH